MAQAQTPAAPSTSLSAFLSRWQRAGGAERANYQLFLSELCDLLQVPHPDPTTPDDSKNAYVFDRSITVTVPDGTTTTNFIDLYKRLHFVLETKQGVEQCGADALVGPPGNAGILPAAPAKPKRLKKGHGIRNTPLWNDALLRAKSQAESYVRNIPDDNPPFLLIVDVGYSIETYADFSGLGKTYTPFPDNLSHRIYLQDLADEKRGPNLLDRLKKIWTDPQSLNPAHRTAKVTRKIAANLALLSQSLEKTGHHPEAVAHFLMRVLFTLFAEDVHLIPNNAFTRLLDDIKDTPDKFAPMAQAVWQNMDKGGFSPVLLEDLLRFNGGLFADTQALKLTGNQLELLIDAAHQDWSDVEPAIFGTLLERALNPTERHKLGAHYTPRAYVERLVLPTVIEPLREEWQTARTAASAQANKGDLKKAIKTVGDFLKHLCSITILDPACGSGNFLYVTLEHLKRLEGEVQDFLAQFPNTQLPLEYTGLTVDPHQLRGIEINPRAAAIADLVLWIGYLQWHFRTHGNTMPAEPVLRKFDNIECRDAVLAYDSKEIAREEHAKPLSRWDGRTFKKSTLTGDEVPNIKSRVTIYNYVNPCKAAWPQADYVVGNPPFIGIAKMRDALGDGYTEALRRAYSDLPESLDFVMYWWDKAAELARAKKIKRFGFIATNSLTQTYGRRVLQKHLTSSPRLSIVFAVPDHPWVDTADGASVRIAMATGIGGTFPGSLLTVEHEVAASDGSVELTLTSNTGEIAADLRIGPRVSTTVPLKANANLTSRGVCLFGAGFIISGSKAKSLGLGTDPEASKHIRAYLNGRDLTGHSRNANVIDLFGLTVDEARKQVPKLLQHVMNHVKPERDSNRDDWIRQNWWVFGRPRTELREYLQGLKRYVATVETAKHRVFVFLGKSILPDNMLFVIASDDPFVLGTLSSRIHTTWALAAGGTLEDRPRYTQAVCWDPFPFPACTARHKSRIRKIAEELDAFRKQRQTKHPELTLTDMYNVLEKLRAVNGGGLSAAEFSPRDRQIHDHGLISILLQLHEDLDKAVFDAYGWPPDLTDDQLLENLVALNHQRAEEEKRGLIKYLRPEFQKP